LALSEPLRVVSSEPSPKSEYDVFMEAINDPATVPAADKSMSATMRELVDLWIDSGKSPSNPGLDSPAIRNIEAVLTGQPSSLFERIERGLLRHVGTEVKMHPDGSWVPALKFLRFDCSELKEYSALEAFKRFGRRVAMYWFLDLLAMPEARLIARCDSCRSYFERQRPRSVKNGVFCTTCKGKASVKRTNATRDARRAAMWEVAAKSWNQWTYSHRSPDRPTWVAQQVNKECKSQIQRKWVSQNREKFLNFRKGLANAES
jgi:hypothetical protein